MPRALVATTLRPRCDLHLAFKPKMGNRGGKAKRSAAKAASEEAPPPLSSMTQLDAIAASLQRCGVGCVRVEAAAETLHARCFAVAKGGMVHCAAADPDHPLAISPAADSAHATGIHAAVGNRVGTPHRVIIVRPSTSTSN